MKTLRALGAGDTASEIVMTTGTRLHMLRPVASSPEHYLHFVLELGVTSLALARIHLAGVTGHRERVPR